MTQKKTRKNVGAPEAATKKTEKNWQPKTWAQIGKLAEAALTTLEAGDIRGTRDLLRAIRGVALAADRDRL